MASSLAPDPVEAAPPVDIAQIITIVTSGGITAGGLLTLAFIMLTRGVLWTNTAHQEVIKAKDDAHTKALDALQSAHSTALDAVGERQREALADRDYYRDAAATERARADKLQVEVSEEVVPLVKITNKILEGLNTAAEGRSS